MNGKCFLKRRSAYINILFVIVKNQAEYKYNRKERQEREELFKTNLCVLSALCGYTFRPLVSFLMKIDRDDKTDPDISAALHAGLEGRQ